MIERVWVALAAFFISSIVIARDSMIDKPEWSKHFTQAGVNGTIVVVDERKAPATTMVFDRERAAPEQAIDECRHADDERHDGERTQSSHGGQRNRQIPYRATSSGYSRAGNSLTLRQAGSIIV